MKYIKKTLNGKTIVVAKIMKHDTLWAYDNEITCEDNSLQDMGNEFDFHIGEGYVECTKQEFDEFYINTAKYLNEKSSI